MKSFLLLIQKEWRLLLFGFVMMFVTSPGQTYFIALFGGEVREALSLSHGEFGAVYSMATLSSAVALLWTGTLVDRIDLRQFSRYIVIGLALACLVLASSQNIFMLFIGIFLLRQLGQGLIYMASTTAMVRYLESNKGKASALSRMGYSVAEATLPTAVVLLLLVMSWRESWVFIAAVLVVCVPLIIHFLLKGHGERHQAYLQNLAADDLLGEKKSKKPVGTTDNVEKKAYRRRQWTRAEVIRDPLFYLFTPGLLAQSLLFTGFMFHQIHLVEEKGWSLSVWASLYLLYALTTFVMNLFVGVLADRFGAVYVAVTSGMAYYAYCVSLKE